MLELFSLVGSGLSDEAEGLQVRTEGAAGSTAWGEIFLTVPAAVAKPSASHVRNRCDPTVDASVTSLPSNLPSVRRSIFHRGNADP